MSAQEGSAQAGRIVSVWEPAFRHSAGRRGSHFMRAVRDDRRILGWKTPRLGVTVPPVESGEDGEWVEVGPGATLVGYAPGDDVAAGDAVFAAVKIDGADTITYARLVRDDRTELVTGMRLVADFPETAPDTAAFPRFRPAPPCA